jgi:DNA-binding NtrC family response regulator
VARNSVLIIEDDAGIRFGVRDYLEANGYEVYETDSLRQGMETFRTRRPDAVVTDYLLPDGNAFDLLPQLKAIDPECPLVVLTGHGSIELAVRAIKEGADHFLTKPVELSAIAIILQRLLENQRNRRKQLVGKTRQARRSPNPFIGASPAILKLSQKVERMLSTDSPILIQGETGTGKGVLARWLHSRGPRAEEAFVDLNCAGLSRELLETELFGHEKGAFTGAAASKAGLFEIAHRGTVFLDEIGDMDQQVQPKLLKVLEEKRFRRVGDVRERLVDIRLIAATHQDLARLVREKRFRSDLYFRINTIPITLPPLRERLEDIPLLASHILKGLTADLGRREIELSPEAEKSLQSYPWPGNIRELRNVLERAILLSDDHTLSPGDLYFEGAWEQATHTSDSSLTLEEVERRHIERTLEETQGNVEEAARRLGIPRSTLYKKIKQYG